MNGTIDYNAGQKMGQVEKCIEGVQQDLHEWKLLMEKRHDDIMLRFSKLNDKIDVVKSEMAKLREEFAGYKVRMGTITAVFASIAGIGTAVASTLIINLLGK